MRLILAILIFSAGTTFSQYYEKTRFDRSIQDDFKSSAASKHSTEKQLIFTDYDTRFRAYKSKKENDCYLEKLTEYTGAENKFRTQVLYAPVEALTKLEAWRMAGGRIVDFCRGHKILLLQSNIPIVDQTVDPFFNVIPQDENDIVIRRVADVVLTPLISRAKREIALEEREKINENIKRTRSRRQAQQPRGRFRGQTQSQYLNTGNDQKEGKAEAEATQQSSRAVVSGSRGMGQAQSMSMGSIGCEDCPKYTIEGSPDRYVQVPSTNTGARYPEATPPRTEGGIYTGTGGINTYPNIFPSNGQPGGTMVHPGRIAPGTPQGTPYSNGVRPGTVVTDGGKVYPGSFIPSGGVIPGSGTIREGVSYQGGEIPRTTAARDGATYTGGGPGTIGDGVTYTGGVPGTATGRGVMYPGSVPGTRTEGGVMYPGSAPGTTTGGGAVYPGSAPGTRTEGGVMYPGSVPGTTTGGGVVYPGSVPGTRTDGGVMYPGSVPGTTTGGGVVYPGSVPGTRTEGGTIYPGSVPGTTTGGGVLYPGGVPGTTTGGGVMYPGSVPSTRTEGGVMYPGSAPGTTTGGGAVYPGSVPGTRTEGGVVYPGSVPGTRTEGGTIYPGSVPGTTTGGSVLYPGGVPGTTTGGGVVYPGNVLVPTTGGGAVYPGSAPGPTSGGGVIYPGNVPGPTTGGGVIYPGGIAPDSKTGTPGMRVTYPGTVVPGSLPAGIPEGTTTGGQGINYPSGVPPPVNQMRETVQYPGRIVPGSTIPQGAPGTIPTGTGTYPGSVIPGTTGHIVTEDRTNYRGGYPTGPDGTVLYPGGHLPGTRGPGTPIIQTGSDNTQRIGSDQSGVSYPHDIRYPGGTVIQQPGSAVIPPDYSLQGQYPGAVTWQGQQGQTIPDVTRGGITQGTGQYPSSQTVGQQYPGVEQYPNGMGFPRGTGEVSQYYQQTGGGPSKEDENSDSQASSSVKQTDSGTQASASAQGKYAQGTAQSQVTGTYTGSGSFSAQAGSSDANKSAQTEVSGGKEGATSNAQGTGGYGKSQTQVQLDSESGATSTGAQTSGWNHGTNSQVQASSRGGMADAQANGEGSTSSQAQIGFQPYLKTDEKVERHAKPFRGGGQASAQSGTFRGQSQSQLEGSFQYGITYNGAAQAGSGSGAATSRKPFNFNITDTELFKPFKPYNPQVSKENKGEATNTSDIDYEYNQDKAQQGLQTSSSSRKTVITNATKENSQSRDIKQNHSAEKSQVDDTVYDYEEEYDGEDYDASQMQTSMNAKLPKAHVMEKNNSDYQSQTIHIATGNKYDVHVNQNSNTAQSGDVIQPGESLSGYTVPPGFRGRVKSVAGEETISHGDGKSQSQTVSLIPQESYHENRSPVSETRSLKTNHERLTDNHVSYKEKPHRNNFHRVRNQQFSTDYSKSTTSVPIKQSYYTVTNSFAGKMDDNRNPRKYEHRYYTKSSTCGYFTFSCNIVYGSNGRTKICKPKLPTHPDGTPMKC
ncbi:uncharacterized protein LOC143188365 [Calliopsis andreniformis]|uniref:uncharacterized protein LOC143188365 n=1 Tax=Calliopsis andreniformis TaxID=337506 RepID=UPI003FCCD00D